MNNNATKVLALLCGMVLTVLDLSAETLKVSPTGQWGEESVYSTLTAAYTDAKPGDEIWVGQGDYSIAALITMKSGVNVYGGFWGTETERAQRSQDASLTILRSTGAQILLGISGIVASTEWNGVTFTGANHTGAGAIRVGDNCIINNCIIRNNTTTGNGGGAYLQGNAMIENSLILENVSNGGGGGGGIAAQNTALIHNCVIINNKAKASGGGVFATSHPITVKNCLIANNEASSSGGGVYLGAKDGVAAKIINSTIVRNKKLTATNKGGGVNLGASASMYNSICWGNESETEANSFTATTVVKNCALDSETTLSSGVGNILLETANSGSELGKYYPDFKSPSTVAGIIVEDYAYDFSLADQSVCIDKGDKSLFPDLTSVSVDLAGNPRVYGETIDMGAYENHSVVDTDIASTQGTQMELFVQEDVLYLKGVEGQVTLYNVRGEVVARQVAEGSTSFNITSGIYIVACGDQRAKVVR